MVTFNNDKIQRNNTPTNFGELGVVDMTRLNKSIPFYQFMSNGTYMKKYDKY